MDAIHDFAEHVADIKGADIPASAIERAKTLVLDTIGVGIGGSAGPLVRELVSAHKSFGAGGEAAVFSIGERLPAAAAALCNAYQIHNSEYDCVHEEAVAHVLSAVVPAALACAEREGDISGRRFLEAVVLGVDVASNLGVAANSGLRFFRPATVGAFGATAAVGRLMGFDTERQVHAFALAYGQLCGTMQAHEEGSMMLALQMGFNARNAMVACDLAAAGLTGPQSILEGRFGYFGLFESDGDVQSLLPTLGKIWRIEEVAHKPFPSGRATHGIIDGCLEFRRDDEITAGDIKGIVVSVPPLVHQLVGRPAVPEMDINYARLCARYVAARALLHGTVDGRDFQPAAYRDPATLDLASRIELEVRDDCSENALSPVDLSATLGDGRVLTHQVVHVYGSPKNPFEHDAQLTKFRVNCRNALRPLDDDQTEELIERLLSLVAVDDVSEIARLTVAKPK